MSRRARIAIFLPALALLAGLLAWSLIDIPGFGSYRGPYGYVLNRVVVPERHMSNVVTAIVFDYRGFDTMGEEFILFIAVTGIVLLLRRKEREEHPELDDDIGSDGVRIGGILAVGVAVVVSLWLISFGFVTPGGGFQGGAALASGVLLVFLASNWRAWSNVSSDKVLDPVEGLGAGGYVVIGLAALVAGLPFLTNLLGPGKTGTLMSGGTAVFVNWAAGMEVAAANLILFREFLEEYIVPIAGKRS
ncbi:MAG TPA: hydrogen gas-evolving membrane-bound hydrogenase subunit E [Gaiellaceae bacterium]|jgi:multicomponent Na+:H+ antiporter subunit B